jgi:uncharacterized protein YgbK (DUF1537 family)
MPPERWLIVADDLTGAADCAIAFARRGLAASVAWGVAPSEDAVLAIDADSRRLSPPLAAGRHRTLLEAHHADGTALYKKIDSTLRGQPAAELAETVRFLRAQGRGALAVVAPAFPATGRTTEQGHIRVNGLALEQTSLWARDHSYPTAHLPSVLEGAGLRVQLATLGAVRAGVASLRALVRDACAAGVDAVICDAAAAADLDTIARATLSLADQVFWTGSGGLAQALAQVGPGGRAPEIDSASVRGGILFVVGSVAEASRVSAAMLATDGSVRATAIAPATLCAGPEDAAWQHAAGDIAATLARGDDVLVEIAADPAADLSNGAMLARRLAELLQPAASGMGALFATGGETALALLDSLGATGIRLLDEIETGVPLGITRGALTIPVITKAGAFGDAATLSRCLSHLRRLRFPETMT